MLFPVAMPHANAFPSFGWGVLVTWVVLIIQIIGMLPRPGVARRWEEEERAEGSTAEARHVVLQGDEDDTAMTG